MGTFSSVRQAARPATAPAQTVAAAPLPPSEVRRALRISLLEGAVSTVNISITGAIGGSVFLTGFAMLLGASSFHLGLLGALPFLGQLTGFLGAYLEERVGNRRAMVLYGALAGRSRVARRRGAARRRRRALRQWAWLPGTPLPSASPTVPGWASIPLRPCGSGASGAPAARAARRRGCVQLRRRPFRPTR